ncbi:MAG: hypothetical protein R2707_09020 [Acidimicrobiales bacterium]
MLGFDRHNLTYSMEVELVSQRATDVYVVEHQPAAFWRRIPRFLVVFVTNVLSMGSGPANPGGNAVRIVDKRTGRVVATVVEQLGDDGQGTVSSMTADLAEMAADEFAEKWL